MQEPTGLLRLPVAELARLPLPEMPRLPLPETTVCLDLPEGWEKLVPTPEVRLSLAEVRMLLRAVLSQPAFDAQAALALLRYQQRRKAASYRSHRKHRLRRLDELRSRNLSL